MKDIIEKTIDITSDSFIKKLAKNMEILSRLPLCGFWFQTPEYIEDKLQELSKKHEFDCKKEFVDPKTGIFEEEQRALFYLEGWWRDIEQEYYCEYQAWFYHDDKAKLVFDATFDSKLLNEIKKQDPLLEKIDKTVSWQECYEMLLALAKCEACLPIVNEK